MKVIRTIDEVEELKNIIRLADDCAGISEGVGLLYFIEHYGASNKDSKEYIKLKEILDNEM